MNFIYNFIPEEVVTAIGWTIFHSIWQGIVVAIFLGASILLTSKKSARLRYNISVVALITMFVLSAATFLKYYDTPEAFSKENITVVPSGNSNVQVNNSEFSPVFGKPKINFTVFAKTYFNNHLSLIVSAWLIGFLFFSFRFAGGLLHIQKLKSVGLNKIGNNWSNRAKELADKIHLKNVVGIYESAQVKVPAAIGYLKPIILLPIGIICNLPQDQVEAILVHELAHIKRYDYLVKLFQSFIETIFFYHPVVWIISSTINSERENCCDDIAVQVCGNSLSYSKALYNLQQIRSKETELVLAAIGKKNQLYRRIIRMNTNNTTIAYGVRFAAFTVLLIAMAAVSIFSSSSTKNQSSLNLAAASFVNPFVPSSKSLSLKSFSNEESAALDTTTLKNGKRTIRFYDDQSGKEKKYKAELNNGKLFRLYIDAEEVAENDLSKYEGLVLQKVTEYDSLMKDYRQNMKNFKASMKGYRDKMKNLGFKSNRDFYFDHNFPGLAHEDFSALVSDSTDWKEMMENIQRNLKENLANLSVNIPPINIPPIDLHKLREQLKHCQFDTAAFRKSMKEFKDKMKDFRFDMEKFKEEMKKSGPNSEAFKKSMEELKLNMNKLNANMKILKDFIGDVKNELVSDRLIENKEDLDSITLSKDELVVNGKTASPELQKKYLEMYKKHYGKELEGDEKFQINN